MISYDYQSHLHCSFFLTLFHIHFRTVSSFEKALANALARQGSSRPNRYILRNRRSSSLVCVRRCHQVVFDVLRCSPSWLRRRQAGSIGFLFSPGPSRCANSRGSAASWTTSRRFSFACLGNPRVAACMTASMASGERFRRRGQCEKLKFASCHHLGQARDTL